MLRRVAAVLEVRPDLVPRWRGADLDRMIAAGHARMHEQVTQLLSAAGWDVHSEVSFNHFGERGVVDIVAWSAGPRALLLVELKTEIVDVSDLLSTMDRRRRLAHQIAAPLKLEPDSVSRWVVVADTRTNRRRLADHRLVLRLAFPRDGRAISGWLRSPVGPIDALSFLPDDIPRSTRHAASGTQRVRARPPCTTVEGRS